MKLLPTTLALLLLFLMSSYMEAVLDGASLESFCVGKCKVRCSKAKLPRCFKYCRLCCRDCKCVPSGTYGNKDECPCYRDKLTRKKTSKCP